MKKISLFLAVILVAVSIVGCTSKALKTGNNAEDEKDDITITSDKHSLNEGEEDGYTVEVEWTSLELSEQDAEKYPLLAKRFEEMNIEGEESALRTKDSLVEYLSDFPQDEFPQKFYSRTDFVVQRADKHIVSLIGNYSGYEGGAHGYYFGAGININPETGEDVSLFEVINDKDALDEIVFDYLIENYSEALFDNSRENFYESYKDGYNWSVDCDKLTVYFNPYEITPYVIGLVEVDVMFDEYHELFDEKYTA